MSIQLLRDEVYKKCEKRLVEFDKIEDAPMARIHKEIRKGFALELNKIINSFVSELSKYSSLEKKKEFVFNFKELFASKEFKAIFQHDIYYSNEYKKKCIEDCDISDTRTTKGFLFDNESKDEKSYDFYCVFLGKLGWNSWVEEFSPADYIISVEHNNTDNSIVQRYEIRNLRKELNSIPFLEIENYVPRISILEEIFSLFEQKNKKINITGISGIGKTFLAKHFIQHYSENFSHIVWLYCSKGLVNAITSEKGIELLDNLGLVNELKAYSEGVFEASSLLSLVINRLRKIEGNNLLILDNVDESIYDFEEELSLSPNWKLLTTSQEKLDDFYCYQIPFFNKEATSLFYKFYTLEKDDNNLNKILSTIQYHTLTIELLAKTAQQRGIGIINIVNRFIESGLNIVDKTKLITRHSKERKLKVENIEEYLGVIFDTSNLSENELKILLNIALLQSEIVNKNLFSEVFLCGNKEVKNAEILDADLEILFSKGWLTESGDNLSIHNLIKNVLLKRLKNHLPLISNSLHYLANRLEIFVLEDFENSINYFKLGESIIDNTQKEKKEEFKIIAKPLSSFYNHIGLHIMSMDLYSQYFSKEVDKNKTWEIIDYYNDLASKLFLMGEYKEALIFAEFIYDLFTEDEDSPLYIRGVMYHFNKLCNSEFTKSNFEKNKESKNLFDRMFKNISVFLDSARILGVLLGKRKDIEKGKKIISDCIDYYQILIEGLSISIKIGDNNSIIPMLVFEECRNKWVTTIHDYGNLFLLNKEDDIALHYFNEVKRMLNELERPLKTNLYRIYKDLALFYMNKGDFEKSLEYIVEFLKVADKIPENSLIKLTINDLIDKFEFLITKENNSKIGKAILDDLNTSIEKSFLLLHQEGRNYTDLITYYNILSFIHCKFKFFNEAIVYKKKGLQILKHSNENEIEIVKSYNFIAGCFLMLQKNEDGLIYINKSLKILSKNSSDSKDLLVSTQKIKKIIIISSNNIDIVKLEILEKIQLVISSIPDLDKGNISKFIDSILNDKSTNKEITFAFLNLYISENTIPDFNILIQCYNILAKVYFDGLFYEKAIALKLRQLGFIKFFASGQMIILIANVYEHLAVYYSAIPMYEKANRNIVQAISGYRLAIEKNNQEIELEDLKICLENAIKIQNIIQVELKKIKY